MSFLRPRYLGVKEVSLAIDIVRGLAILLVVLLHTSQQFVSGSWGDSVPLMNAIGAIFHNGAAGVVLFFVISGFLMELLYGGRKFAARKFWSRRIARIWPLWLFWSIVATLAANVSLLASGMGSGSVYGSGVDLSGPNGWLLLLLQLIFLGWLVPSVWQATPGGWSIQAEMANYVIYVPVQKFHIGWVFGIYGILEISYIIVRPFVTTTLQPYVGIFDAALSSPLWFLLGVLAQRLRRFSSERTPVRWQTWVAVISATLIGMTMRGPFIAQAKSMVVVVLCIAIALVLARLSKARWLQKVGKYSYGMYFAHFLFLVPCAWLVNLILTVVPNDLRGPLQVALFAPTCVLIIVLSMAVAVITFRVIENPILVWVRRQSSDRPQKIGLPER